MMAMHKVKERLYLTADKRRVVEEGDPEAAYLYAAAGTEVPEDEARRYGLLGGRKPAEPEPVVVYSTAADPEPEAKPVADDPDEDKSAKPESKADDKPDEVKARMAPPENKGVPAPRARRD